MKMNAPANSAADHKEPTGDPFIGSDAQEQARSLWQELVGLAHDRFRLAALETRRAGESLVAIVAAGVMVAVVLSCAWMGIAAAAVLKLVEYGFPASNAILVAVAFNVLVALLLCAVIRRESRYLQFPATLRSLQPVPTERGIRVP